MPIETPTWENSTDVPTWDNSKDETPTWENSREPATATVSTEIPQSQIKLPMRFLPGGMNEPGTQEEKLAEVAGIYQMALSAPNYVVGKVEQFLGVPPAAQEFLQKPLINPQPSPEDIAFRKEHPVVGGIESGIVDLAKSFTSPIGIATLGMAKLPQTAQKAVSLAFAGQMASQAPELATQIIDEYQKPDSPERTQNLARLFTTAGGTTLFAGVAVKHGLSPQTPPALPSTIGEPNATSSIASSTRIPEQQVRARMGGQAPLQPGGATPDVQAQPTIAEAKPPEVAPELTALAPETAKAVQETTPNLGGAITEKSVEQQALSAQNNSLKAFADANGVEFVPGDTPETIFAKVQAKTAELPANAPKEAPVVEQPAKSAGEQIAPSPAETVPSGVEEPSARRDLLDEGVTKENVEALLSGKKSAEQVVDEQLGIFKKGGSVDAKTIIVLENSDGSRSIGFAPPAGPASTEPVNVGQMSHMDAIELAREQGVSRINEILSRKEQIGEPTPSPVKPASEASVVSTTEQQKSKVEPTVESVTPPNEISVGPGARSPSDIPGGTLESQLLDELNRLPSGEKGLGSPTIKIADHVAESIQTGKDALAKWWLRTKAGAEQYRRLLFGPPRTENDFWSTKKDWVANRQVNSGVAREMIKSGKKLVPRPLERRAMGKYAEALMFDDPEAQLKTWAEGSKLSSNREQYEAALKLSDDQKQSVRQAIQYYEAKGRELQDAGMLNSLVEDYAGQHMVDRRNLNSDALNSLRADLIRGTLNTNFKYALRRIFETEFALEQAGGKLKTTDLFDKLANYAKTANDVLADRTAVKAWMAGETSDAIPRPLFATGQGRALIEAQGERPNDALLVNPKVRPRPTVKDKEGNPVDVSGEYVKLDHPAFKKWQWVETTPEGKQIFVQGDIWAHRSIADELKNTMGRSRLYDIPGIDTITRVNAQLKGIKLVGFFHQTKTGIHALTHLVNPFGQPKIDVHSPEVYSAMRAGLQLFETRLAEIFSEGLASSSILQAIPKIGPILKAYQEYLFQDYIPRIKMATYRAALERNLSRYGDRVSRNDLEQITATQVNSAYGELNWKLMGINPTFQHGLRLALLAPDFQAAQHGFLAQAFTRFGGENRMSLAIMAAALYTGTRIANQILDKDPHWEMDRAFSVIFHGHEYGIRTVASDVKRAFTDLSSFLYHRLSPLASSAVELMTKSNALGQKETGAQALKNVALRAVPIPLTPREDVPFMQAALASTLGYYTKRYSAIADVNKLAMDWRKKNDPKFVDEPSQYPQSAFLPMRRHLEQGDMAGAAHEYNALLKTRTPAQILTAMGQHRAFTSAKFEPRFFASLNDEQKQRYREALQERKELFRRFLEARNMANHLRASEQTKP